MKDICKNCGAWHGLHRSDTKQCPRNGIEAQVGSKQLWQASTYEEEAAELATLRAQLAEAREALQPFAKYGEKCGEHEESDWEFRIKGKHFAKALKVYNELVTTA